MSLLRITLRQDRTGVLGWGLGLFVMTLAVGASYASIKDDTASFEEAFESFGGIEDAFGVDSLTSPDGYFRSNSVALFPLLLGIYGAFAAMKHLCGAEETGRLDHVLSRPLTRMQYVGTAAGGLAMGQGAILLLAAIGGAIGYVVAGVASSDVVGVLLMTLEALPIALAHLALCVLAAAWAHRKGPAIGITMGIVVGGYALDLIGKLVDGLGWLEYATLYGYWSRSDWFNGDVDAAYLVVSVLVTVGATGLALWKFDRKDIF